MQSTERDIINEECDRLNHLVEEAARCTLGGWKVAPALLLSDWRNYSNAWTKMKSLSQPHR